MGAKYHVLQFWGAPVFQDASGDYQLKLDQNQHCKLHQWRIGKHTKGTYRRPGQVFFDRKSSCRCHCDSKPVTFPTTAPLGSYGTVFADSSERYSIRNGSPAVGGAGR